MNYADDCREHSDNERSARTDFFLATWRISLLLDDENRWTDYHSFAVDGPVMHRDVSDPEKLHVYLLSYERHSLIGHWIIDLKKANELSQDSGNAPSGA